MAFKPPFLLSKRHRVARFGFAPVGNSGDNPPFQIRARTATQLSIATQWRPSSWPYVFEGGTQPYAPLSPPAAFVAIDNPPFRSPANTPAQQSIKLAHWQPSTWPYSFQGDGQPYAQAKLSPAFEIISGDIVGTNLACGHPGPTGAIATSSVSIAGNSVVLVSVYTLDSSTARTVSTITGAGLTWTSVASQSTTSSNGDTTRLNATVFKAIALSATSGALVITLSLPADVDTAYSVDQFSGVDTSAPIVQSSTRTASNEIAVFDETLALSSNIASGSATYGAGVARTNVSGADNLAVGTGYSSLCSTTVVSSPGFSTRTEWRPDGQQNVTWTYSPSGEQIVFGFAGVGVELRASLDPFFPTNRSISQQHYFAPVWPYTFSGAAQPYAPSRQPPSLIGIDDPPFQHREKIITNRSIAIGQWQPPAWPFVFFGAGQPYSPVHIQPTLLNTIPENPPFGYPSTIVDLSIVSQLWQPPSWPFVFMGGAQPYMPGHLQPNRLTVTVDDPPFGYPSSLINLFIVGMAWQPPAWPYVFMGDAQPYMPGSIPSSILNAIVDNPPFQNAGRTAVELIVTAWQWQPPAWPYVFGGGAQPYMPGHAPPSESVVIGDYPPLGYPLAQIRLSLVGRAWQPVAWPFVFMGGLQPYATSRLHPSITAAVSDNPPFRHRGRLPSTIATIFQWQPPSWPFVFLGGAGPYAQKDLPPAITHVPGITGGGKEVRNIIIRCRLVYGPR